LQLKVKEMEYKLKELELKNQGVRFEKDKVQFEFEKLRLDLEQARLEAGSKTVDDDSPVTVSRKENRDNSKNKEIKEEKEVALKNEIKFLINKLLKVKNKLEKQSDELNTTKGLNVTNNNNVPSNNMNNNTMFRKSSCEQLLSNSSLNSSINIQNSSIKPSHGYSSSGFTNTNHNVSRNYQSNPINNICYYAPEKEREEDKPMKSSSTELGRANENFSKNVRSKSNMRFDHNRSSCGFNTSQSGNIDGGNSVMGLNHSTMRSSRPKSPNTSHNMMGTGQSMMGTGQSMMGQSMMGQNMMGSIMNRDALRSNIGNLYEKQGLNSSVYVNKKYMKY